MTKLNQRQELFCLNLICGMTATEAAIKAGYSPGCAKVTASRMLTNANILERKGELQGLATNDNIASVIERKETLTEILRGRFGDFANSSGEFDATNREALKSAALQEVKKIAVMGKDDYLRETTTIKLRDPIDAIRELNKMEGDYAPEKHALLGDIIIEVIHRNRSNATK